MSASRPARGLRKAGIPRNYMTKWQSVGLRAARPLVRRPMTACVSCRAAKVKCDGQPACGRCTGRGVPCNYTTTADGDDPSPGPVLDLDSAALEPTHAAHAADPEPLDPAFDTMADWALDAPAPRLGDLDWGTLDPAALPALDVDVFTFPDVSMPDSATARGSPPVRTSGESTASRSSTGTTGTTTITTPDSAGGSSLPKQLFAAARCQCREQLAALIPKVAGAMRDRHLDDVFKATGDVLRGCQDVVECSACRISCTDLICIMSVFQHTDACFEYIAHADLDGALTMTFGGCEVPINDPKLRAMLVMNLIQEATTVLDAIGTKGQTMLRNLCPPGPLAQANIGYLDTVIRDFRAVLRRVADAVDKSGSRSAVAQPASFAQAAAR